MKRGKAVSEPKGLWVREAVQRVWWAWGQAQTWESVWVSGSVQASEQKRALEPAQALRLSPAWAFRVAWEEAWLQSLFDAFQAQRALAFLLFQPFFLFQNRKNPNSGVFFTVGFRVVHFERFGNRLEKVFIKFFGFVR